MSIAGGGGRSSGGSGGGSLFGPLGGSRSRLLLGLAASVLPKYEEVVIDEAFGPPAGLPWVVGDGVDALPVDQVLVFELVEDGLCGPEFSARKNGGLRDRPGRLFNIVICLGLAEQGKGELCSRGAADW